MRDKMTTRMQIQTDPARSAVFPDRPAERQEIHLLPVPAILAALAIQCLAPERHGIGHVAARAHWEIHHRIFQPVHMAHFTRSLRAAFGLPQRARDRQQRPNVVAVFADVAPCHGRAEGVAGDEDVVRINRVTFSHIRKYGSGERNVFGITVPEVPCLAPPVWRDQQHAPPARRAGDPSVVHRQPPRPRPAMKVQHDRQRALSVPSVRFLDVIRSVAKRAGNLAPALLPRAHCSDRNSPDQGEYKNQVSHKARP
mmetsp:Transcript_18332/g.29384  ORF Transcript_18332/g.29384 Transcript_18332/m.29384 type:complete len:254 (+) Transcript_18332:2715-3476(+)